MTAVESWSEILRPQIGPLRLPHAYVPVDPTAKQEWFLRRNELEVFFGGAAGPGKSWGLLMAALQYVDYGEYHGLLLRPTLGEFEQAGGLIEVAHDWLGNTDAWWHGGRREWSFPSGSTIRFGYLRNVAHLKQFKGPSYSFVGFDELTSFTEGLYRGVFRVLRQALGTLDDVPLRMRAASNPGDIGHQWVKNRFIEPKTRKSGVVFVPATIHDNPYLDYETYVNTVLSELAPVDRERLIRGDWDVTEEGGKFKRQAFRIVDPTDVEPAAKTIRYWDLAATEPHPGNTDPDYTVGLRYEVDRHGTFTIRHIVMGRWNDDKVETTVRRTAEEDGRPVHVYIEQDPGQAGKAQLSNYKRRVLQGFAVHSGHTKIRGVNAAKETRAGPVAAAVGNGLVQIVSNCPHLQEFLDMVSLFPNEGVHDDPVDALAGAHNHLTGRPGGGHATATVPRARLPGVVDRRRIVG